MDSINRQCCQAGIFLSLTTVPIEPLIEARQDKYKSMVDDSGKPMSSFREVLEFYRIGLGG